MRAGLAVLFTLSACAGGSTSCDLSALGEGDLGGSVDGNEWIATGTTWSEAGEGVQINSQSGSGYRVTVSAQKDIGGTAMVDALDAGSFPIEVSFDDEVTAFALLYPDGEPSMTSKGTTGGGLTIESLDADTQTLGACFHFDAVGDATLAVEGSVLATLFQGR